ncbi:MAG TPA: metallophosphoesterase, partial [Bryobacteraceae bacterium]
EEELAARLSKFAGIDPLVLICHTPPVGTKLDKAGADRHFGSKAVRDFIERNQPAYFYCGHVHEAAGREDTIGKTRGWNVGKRGRILELDALVR